MKRPLSSFADIHSHDLSAASRGDTVVSVSPEDPLTLGGFYSVGIHPWDTASAPPSLLRLKRLVCRARDPRIVAIGEAGFDRLRGGPLDSQRRLFRFHARLARRLGLPLIIHCVRAQDILLAEAAKFRPQPGQWIVHGFRGSPAAARQLLDAGIDISLGHRFNPDVPAVVPQDRLYHESDFQP